MILEKYKRVVSLNLCPKCKGFDNTVFDKMMRCFSCKEEFEIKEVENSFDENFETAPIICVKEPKEIFYRIKK